MLSVIFHHPSFKHPPEMSSETVNSKLLGERPHGLSAVPCLPLGTVSHGQSQKDHLCSVLNLPGLREGQVSGGRMAGVVGGETEKVTS